MYIGCQFSLYPMRDDFVDVILSAVTALKRYDGLTAETDDLSTLLVGPPEAICAGLRDCFVAAARQGGHVAMSATLSRGCPGEADAPGCASAAFQEGAAGEGGVDVAGRAREVAARFAPASATGIETSAQISLYPLGRADYMDRILACIEFLKQADVYRGPKHFCSRLGGDASAVFKAIEQAFIGFAAADAHVALTATVSTGSPTSRP